MDIWYAYRWILLDDADIIMTINYIPLLIIIMMMKNYTEGVFKIAQMFKKDMKINNLSQVNLRTWVDE